MLNTPTTRVLRRATALVAAAAFALAACGDSDDDAATPPTSPATTSPATSSATVAPSTAPAESPGEEAGLVPPAEGATEYPLTLTTWAGETVLEERPERIAVVGFSSNLDALQALDVIPVYTQGEEAEWPWRDLAWMSQIEFVDTSTRRDPINYEAIAASDPDLIVAVNFVYEDDVFTLLSEIAPVLEHAEQIDGDKIEWQATQRMIGEALDLSAASERVVDDAEAAIADTAAAHPELAGRTITVATDYSSGLQYYSVQGGTAEGILTMLGFVPNPLAANFVDDPAVSDERVDLLDADVLIVFYFDAATREARESSTVFASLPPVAGGRYVGIDDTDPGSNATWVMRRGASAVSLPWTVDVLAERVSALDLG